jgi:predicted CoA-substrate-specific enzyme activase
MNNTVKSLGICIGATNIKSVELLWNDNAVGIGKTSLFNHGCNPREAFLKMLDHCEFSQYDYVCITGRKIKDYINLPKITELEASEYGLLMLGRLYPGKNKVTYNALISLGSENFMLYELNEKGHIIKVQTGNKCASGTGEFFLQQIRRMNVDIDKAIQLANESLPYKVSGRCSVFCKSDCTHALNKGIPIGNVCAGLGNMIADKILELLQSIKRENIMLVGGVTKNEYVMNKLREKIRGLCIPAEADLFEAMGAAAYAFDKKTKASSVSQCTTDSSTFTFLPPLKNALNLVKFETLEKSSAREGDECILGLDVGSTTTKAILLRTSDNSILGSVYLRTDGNPIQASRECYAEIDRQVGNVSIDIIGLGVTGSGRQIAGLHALTDGIVNEIIAHATAASFFDKEVDTILEIGGQDAKYTYLVNGVSCDYVMNEACSAGTGSFLEEAAKESLDIDCFKIEEISLKAENPPNFNDQCAAFISSDIKNASHENISRENIVAGLVYSICMNYNNRVRGQRKIGEKIFMQGGVCYNKAVPLAMATLLGRTIFVPPEPGLMGAFGVALEIKNRIRLGLLKRSRFKLHELAGREVAYGKSFTCPGTKEHCDRGCSINVIILNGKKYAFGGICNKYYNMVHHITINPRPFDNVKSGQDLIFSQGQKQLKEKGREPDISPRGQTIGIPKSFHVNSLYPLYYNFFTHLGFKVILSDVVDSEGIKMTSSSFCFPAEISHGLYLHLLKQNPDVIFLPVITELHVEKSIHRRDRSTEKHATCIISQGEAYYLKSVFRECQPKIISPVLNFSKGWEKAEEAFCEVARELGCSTDEASVSYRFAVDKQKECFQRRREIGDRVLSYLQEDSSRIAIVLFGRSYNAFSDHANLGIPEKIASRGHHVLPFDCIRYEDEDCLENITWATGQEIIKAANFVKKHPQLFGVYITNFSCGPDSFLVGYFRDIMQTKPSLTLELDSHSADAGINTRIEAFLDIIERYKRSQMSDPIKAPFTQARLSVKGNKQFYISSEGEKYPLQHPRVKILFPSMGRTSTELMAATFRGLGFNSEAVTLPDFKILMIGRKNTSCKECLPLQLTTSSLINYLENRKKGRVTGNNNNDDELLLYFMPTTTGGCRFSQYSVFLNKLIEKKRLKNVALLTLTTENSYAGIGTLNQVRLLKSIVISDIMDDIKNAIYVLAIDPDKGIQIFNKQWGKIIHCFENGLKSLDRILDDVVMNLAAIELKYPIREAKKVLLAGEIFVRRDEFSSGEIVSNIIKRGIVVKRAHVLEWLYYIDFLQETEYEFKLTFTEKLELFIRNIIKYNLEKKIKSVFSLTGLYEYEEINIRKIVGIGNRYMSTAFTGEMILVLGVFFMEMARHIHGLISIGPFACLPTRVIEAILSHESIINGNKKIDELENAHYLKQFDNLPFLSVESDGNPFPQIINSKIEAFCLQVERLYNAMKVETCK